MSDEPLSRQEPRLKLKLRSDKTPDGAPPAVAPSPEAVSPPPPAMPAIPAAPPGAGAPPPSLKLRPRIAIKPSEPLTTAGGGLAAAEPAATATDQTRPEPNPAIKAPAAKPPAAVDLPPPVAPRAADEKTGTGFKFKLKPKGTAASDGSSSPPTAGAAATPEIPAPKLPAPKSPGPVVPPKTAGRPVLIPAIPSRAVSADALSGSAIAPGGNRTTLRKSNRLGLVIGVVGLLVLVAVGFFWYGRFFPRHQLEPSNAAKETPPPATASPAPTPSEAAPAPGEAPAAIETAPPAPSRDLGEPASPSKKRLQPAAPDPSLEFRTFVDRLKGAVRVGPPTRLIVNGLSYRPGEVIDPRLGVVFVGMDTDTKELIFQDATGAVVRRLF